MEVAQYTELASAVVIQILEQETAVVWPEVEARAADTRFGENTISINPHHLSTARQQLLAAGTIESDVAKTKGNHVVETFHLAGTAKREWAPAAARKRALQARYLGWARGTKRHPHGLVGAGAEDVLTKSLLEAAPSGYRIARPEGGDVKEFLGMEVPGGPLDAAAHLVMMDAGVPVGVAAVPVEVKNLRDWIYPHKPELFQLLHKAAQLQLHNQDQKVVPLLVCRRVHYTAGKMAKALGFYIVDLRRQYLVDTPDIEDEALAEVQAGLGYADLLKSSSSDRVLVQHLRGPLPSVAARSANRWAQSAELLHEYFTMLRNTDLKHQDRTSVMADLRWAAAEIEGGQPGGW